ncbi:MAG: adenylate/guanylate cyclase domain-containing protein [archaeon]
MIRADFEKGGVFVVLVLLFVIMIYSNAFANIQNSISDNLHGNGEVLDSIVIVEIDDASLNEIGRWPWNRNVFAEMILKVKGAKVIGVDLSFFEMSDNDSFLGETLSEMDNVVLAAEITDGKLQLPVFDSDYGYVNLIGGSDGVIRSLRTDANVDAVPFSLKIAQEYIGTGNSFNSIERINFVAGPESFYRINAIELLENNFSFENKVVLVGVTAENLHDVYMVPTSDGVAMAGVEIQAHAVQNFVLDSFVAEQGKFALFLLVLIIGTLGLFVFSRAKIYYTLLIVVGGIIFYSFIGIIIFQKFGYAMDFFFFPLALLVFSGVGVGLNYLDEKKNNAYLRDAFGRYVDKSLLGEIVAKRGQLGLGGKKKDITIFFSDIRGFTDISEKLSPEKLGHLINRYFTEMTKIILEYRGTVDKFIGDAVMAFWNAPLDERDHALLGCRSALAQVAALIDLNEALVEEDLPALKIGCGLNTGEVVVGNFGSDDRFDYTVFGDSVNLASRLEGLTKYYGVSIIISETTYNLVKDELPCRKLDVVRVKGKRKPIAIYELLSKEDGKFVNLYEAALGMYFKSNFKEAKILFARALNVKKRDLASLIFVDRCERYLKNSPGKDWDGSFEMTSK